MERWGQHLRGWLTAEVLLPPTSSGGFLATRLHSAVVLPTPSEPVMMLVGMGRRGGGM